MSSFTTESDSDSSTPDFFEIGQLGYQYEPEYIEEEIAQMETERQAERLEIENNPRRNNTDWCSCSRCISMPLPSECLCCQEFHLLEEAIEHGHCVTENTDFRTVCLNPVVLTTSYVSFLRYKRRRGRAPDELTMQ